MQDSVYAALRDGVQEIHCFGLLDRCRGLVDGVQAGDHVGEIVIQQELTSKVLHVDAQVPTAVNELPCSEQVASIATIHLSCDDGFLREQRRL